MLSSEYYCEGCKTPTDRIQECETPDCSNDTCEECEDKDGLCLTCQKAAANAKAAQS